MDLDEALKRVAVIGAAGKMGKGIALLLLQEMARSEAESTGLVGSGEYHLLLIDSDEQALTNLKQYLRKHLITYAEKNINKLRQYYADNPDLVSNEEIVKAFVDGAQNIISDDTEILAAKNAIMVFEAIVEDLKIKTDVYKALKNASSKTQYYFTNTSSIPISELNQASQLQNRIIGFHFYNPPTVQKLIEIILPQNLDSTLKKLASDLAIRLNKKIINAKDVAGFIGNGHFIREILFACNQAQELSQQQNIPIEYSIFLINRITQDYLLRPMGIFQLIDYVGIDVCQNIINTMRKYLKNELDQCDLLEKMLAAGIKGGQHSDGSPREGFFKYDQQAIQAVFSLKDRQYHLITNDLQPEQILGIAPSENITWKHLQREINKQEKIQHHFDQLKAMNTTGAVLAKAFLANSKKSANELVQSGIAEKLTDVDVVLKNGFFHLYGPNEF